MCADTPSNSPGPDSFLFAQPTDAPPKLLQATPPPGGSRPSTMCQVAASGVFPALQPRPSGLPPIAAAPFQSVEEALQCLLQEGSEGLEESARLEPYPDGDGWTQGRGGGGAVMSSLGPRHGVVHISPVPSRRFEFSMAEGDNEGDEGASTGVGGEGTGAASSLGNDGEGKAAAGGGPVGSGGGEQGCGGGEGAGPTQDARTYLLRVSHGAVQQPPVAQQLQEEQQEEQQPMLQLYKGGSVRSSGQVAMLQRQATQAILVGPGTALEGVLKKAGGGPACVCV